MSCSLCIENSQKRAINMIRRILKYIKNDIGKREKIISWASRSSFLSAFYYWIFNDSFYRETKAVLTGRISYLENIKNGNGNRYLLTRNIHRIEKGLLMKPRKDLFALDYIEETIKAYEACILNPSNIDSQVKWYTDVLSLYFENIRKHDMVEGLHNRFLALQERPKTDNNMKRIPYLRELENKNVPDYNSFLNLTKQRRSVRWFEEKKVPRELLNKAIEAAGMAPSACNRQPFEYRIFDIPDLLKKVVEIPMGTKGYAHNIPVFIVVIGNLDAYYDERDRHLIYIDASLANMNFMLALETLGLSSCPVNWPDLEEKEKKMAKFLNLKTYQRPIMCIAVGYPSKDGLVACSEKRDINSMRYYNF